jgi:hypothetical protein
VVLSAWGDKYLAAPEKYNNTLKYRALRRSLWNCPLKQGRNRGSDQVDYRDEIRIIPTSQGGYHAQRLADTLDEGCSPLRSELYNFRLSAKITQKGRGPAVSVLLPVRLSPAVGLAIPLRTGFYSGI